MLHILQGCTVLCHCGTGASPISQVNVGLKLPAFPEYTLHLIPAQKDWKNYSRASTSSCFSQYIYICHHPSHAKQKLQSTKFINLTCNQTTNLHLRYFWEAVDVNPQLQQILNEGKFTLKLLAWDVWNWMLKKENVKSNEIKLRFHCGILLAPG
jgi:hypothetical protein